MALVATKPTEEIGWALNVVPNGPSSGDNKVDYTVQYRDQGYNWKEKPPREYENMWKYNMQFYAKWACTEIVALDSRVAATEATAAKYTRITTTPVTLPVLSLAKRLVDVTASAKIVNLNDLSVDLDEVQLRTKGNAGAFNVTINPGAGRTINGTTSYTLSLEGSSIDLLLDGTNWVIIQETAKSTT